MSLKTKKMDNLLKPIALQANKLSQLVLSSRNDPVDVASVKSMLLSQLHALIEQLENLQSSSENEETGYEDMKRKITAIIEEFCTMSSASSMKQVDDSVVSVFVEKLTTAFKNLEALEYVDLEQQLQDSLCYIEEMGEVNQIEDFENIKELGESLLDMLGPLQNYGKNLISKLLRDKLALYICQLCAAFSMLTSIVQEQHEINLPIYNSKKYICERTCSCIKLILSIFEAKNPDSSEEINEKVDHFVYKMDLALDLISNLSGKSQEAQISECNDLWTAVEDVFSHAMVIAQVCDPENFKAITGVCQSVMSEYDNLKEQITSDTPDPMLNSLFINTFTDALYRLERKINISVLSLMMEVFSDPFGALKKLVKMCGNSLATEKRSKNDLSDLIDDFDQLTDKVMQIGLNAVACCNDINRVTRIKNHMASLESLEAELVPSIVAFYLHPDNKEMRATVKLFTIQWQLEINKLRNAIDLIIDSAAFCQVVLDHLQDNLQKMSNDLDDRQTVTQAQVQIIVQRACTLATQITTAVDDVGRENIDKQTLMMIRELKAAIFETDTAAKTLLKDKPTEPQQLRVIKRCELLLNVVKRLQPALVVVMNNSQTIKAISENTKVSQRDILQNSTLNFPSSISKLPRDEMTFTFVKTPYTVTNYKPTVSIQSAKSTKKSPVSLSCLIPYIEKGRTMRTERTIIMYKTPKSQKAKNDQNRNTDSNKNANTLRRDLSCVRQHLFSRESFDSERELDLSCESWNLTGILEKLSCISSSLNSTCAQELNQSDDINSSIGVGRVSQFSSMVGGDTPSAVDTPDRLTDIHKLEKKIEMLKTDIVN